MDDRKKNFESKKKISAKIASGHALFPPLVKAKNQHQNFENTSNKKDAQ